MYKRYSGIKLWLLSYITCGIYGIIVWHTMVKEHNKMADSIGEKKIMGYIPACLLSFITCGIFGIIWFFKYFSQLKNLDEAKDAGVTPSNRLIMMLIALIPIYSCFWIAKASNKLAEAYDA